jgi:predicted RNA-binding Zn-ribbon protein involved in translation (DUF1610 family)
MEIFYENRDSMPVNQSNDLDWELAAAEFGWKNPGAENCEMHCPKCGSRNIVEIDNLHMIWKCLDCGFTDDGSEFDPEYAGSEDVLDWQWDTFVEES